MKKRGNHILTKKDVKDVVVSVLSPFAKAIQGDFARVHKRLDGHDKRFDRLEIGLTEVKEEVRAMRENASELFTKLDKFIVLYEKQESEMHSLVMQVRRLEERILKLEAEKASPR